MGVPQSPVQIGTFDIRSIDCLARRLLQSRTDLLLTTVDHFALDLDHPPILAGLMNRGIMQIIINDTLWAWGPPGLARRRRRNQFVKQLAKDRPVMGEFIRDKQGLALTAVSQILQNSPGIVQFATADPERNQQARGGVDGRPDPRPPVLTFDIFGAARTFLFFTKVHSSSSCVSVSSNEVNRLESTWAQCSPARKITRLTVSLSISNRRAVARTPTPSAAW